MSTALLLIDELKALATEVVANYQLETKHRATKPPMVVSGYLPEKGKGQTDFPFVIVRLLDATDDQGQSTVHVKLLVGTYSENEQEGWMDVASILERLRQALMTRRVVAKRFMLELPLKYELPEEQPFPEWVGWMTTTWVVAQPVWEEIEDE